LLRKLHPVRLWRTGIAPTPAFVVPVLSMDLWYNTAGNVSRQKQGAPVIPTTDDTDELTNPYYLRFVRSVREVRG
jgi:hypothetical protein